MRYKNKIASTVLVFIYVAILIAGCVSPPMEEEKLILEETVPTLTPVPESPPAITITEVLWNTQLKIIEIIFDPFPSVWENWIMYIDGEEMPIERGRRKPVVCPNAPLNKNPTGLIIGTLPWIGPLTKADFPCCGTIQFYIPQEGFTNEYEFNLIDFGCRTASSKNINLSG